MMLKTAARKSSSRMSSRGVDVYFCLELVHFITIINLSYDLRYHSLSHSETLCWIQLENLGLRIIEAATG